ncbi:hypothetical protein J2T09_000007 [Neorhizobium huautlense]|uniref:Transposase n=1 Tax=Neorhizobium huautlense TaxID=67774 RepID=A0ABT9PM25_9HYPH|nr:hypothetical protein [Neorhizobium huautlense]MDP9835266.1 hypothetical protein [Neorhizobium huautlense]
MLKRWMTVPPFGASVAFPSEPTPERTTFVRFRDALITHRLAGLFFDSVTRQRKGNVVRVKTGGHLPMRRSSPLPEPFPVELKRWFPWLGKVWNNESVAVFGRPEDVHRNYLRFW